jgi:hypothetical protein
LIEVESGFLRLQCLYQQKYVHRDYNVDIMIVVVLSWNHHEDWRKPSAVCMYEIHSWECRPSFPRFPINTSLGKISYQAHQSNEFQLASMTKGSPRNNMKVIVAQINLHTFEYHSI